MATKRNAEGNRRHTDLNTSVSMGQYGNYPISNGETLDMTTNSDRKRIPIAAIVVESGASATVTGTQVAYDDVLKKEGLLPDWSSKVITGPAEVILHLRNAVIVSAGGETIAYFGAE